MKIDITEEERKDLENIFELLQSNSIENINLGVSLIKQYKKFKNTVFTFDCSYVYSYIPREVNTNIKECYYHANDIIYFRFNSLFYLDLESISNVEIRTLKFFITGILNGHDSFYKG